MTMKKIIIFAGVLLISLLPFTQTSASISSDKIESVYKSFSSKLDKKYSTEKQTSILNKLRDLISWALENNISSWKREILEELAKHNNNYLFDLYMKGNTSHVSQESVELKSRILLKSKNKTPSLPQEIKTLIDSGKKLYITNETYDFVDGSTIKKVRFSTFFPIDASVVTQLSNMDWIIVYSTGTKDYKLIPHYTFEEKIPYSKLEQTFAKFTTYNTNFIEEGNTYYSYIFDKFSYIDDPYWVYLSDLEKLSISPTNHVLYKSEEKEYRFLREYKKKKLIDKDIIDGIVDKHIFLEHIRSDKRDLTYDTDLLFSNLKQTTENLVQNKKKQQDKIQTIYDWVLKNTTYTEDIDLEDEKIFSWIDTYKNGDWVCTGYSKLTSYMLMLAWISGSEVIRGDVIDARDFPQIGHAWLKIGDSYYDPTFDDPVWALSDKEEWEYKYYNLPRELFYTNRYDKWDTPEELKSLTLESRADLVAERIYNISSKYESEDYLLVQGAFFRKEHNIAYNTPITPTVLATVIPLYQVSNNSFTFQQDGKTKNIKSLKYYILDNDSTESVLRQINYDIQDSYFFLWETASWQQEYRLAYDISF